VFFTSTPSFFSSQSRICFTSGPQPPQDVPGHFAVVEGNRPVGKGLARLVALAGDEDDVALLRTLERGRDRGGAVGLALRRPVGPRQHLGDDRLRIFAPRVVGRDDDDVRELGRDRSHPRPLLPVAVAAAAEHADDAARRERPRLGEDVRERRRRMGVVDEHGERLPLVDGLESPGNAGQVRDAARDRLVLDVQ